MRYPRVSGSVKLHVPPHLELAGSKGDMFEGLIVRISLYALETFRVSERSANTAHK